MPMKRRKKIICPKQLSPTMRFVERLKWKMFGNSKLFSYHLLRRPGNTSWPSLVPERTLRSSTIHTVKFAINKESFNFKESTNRLSMTALSSCRVPYAVLASDVIPTNSPIFQSYPHTVIPKKMTSTGLHGYTSNDTLKGRNNNDAMINQLNLNLNCTITFVCFCPLLKNETKWYSKRFHLHTVWREIFAGVYFCWLVIFCVLREQSCAIRTEWFFLLGINFLRFSKSTHFPALIIFSFSLSTCNRNTYFQTTLRYGVGFVSERKRQVVNELYSPRNDPDPGMIPNWTPKWHRPGNNSGLRINSGSGSFRGL